MSIIIEGIDGTGKSTLCEALSKSLKLTVAHAGSAPTDELEANTRLDDDVRLWSKSLIQDRSFFISNFIYETVLRNGQMLASDVQFYAKLLALHLNEAKTHLIFCDADDEVFLNPESQIIKAYDTEEHIKAMSSKSMELAVHYRSFIRNISLFAPVIFVNPRNETDLVQNLTNYLGDYYVQNKNTH